MSQTDKMLSRKEGGTGFVIFNNPERHNAVSLDMWEAAKRMLDDFATDDDIRVVVLTGAGGRPSFPAPIFRNSEASAPRSRRRAPTMPRPTRPMPASPNFPSRPVP